MVDRRAQGSLNDAIRQGIQRQVAFLKRKHSSIASKDIKPRKRHRKSALQWLLSLDNQVRVCSKVIGCPLRVLGVAVRLMAFARFGMMIWIRPLLGHRGAPQEIAVAPSLSG